MYEWGALLQSKNSNEKQEVSNDREGQRGKCPAISAAHPDQRVWGQGDPARSKMKLNLSKYL